MTEKSRLSFPDRSIRTIVERRSVLCLGLDPQIGHIAKAAPQLLEQHGLPLLPEGDYRREHWKAMADVFEAYCLRAMQAVGEEAYAVKPQSAFWEVCGSWGMAALESVAILAEAQGYVVINDAKRGDGGDTAKAYARTYLGRHSLYDALTIQPYIGTDCVAHFVDQARDTGRIPIVVVKTSFKRPDAPCSEVEMLALQEGIPVWQAVARLVDRWGQETETEGGYRRIGVVMGATFPADAPTMRSILPNTWFLVPGYGAQGGGADEAVLGADENGFGITVNSSRGLLYPKDGDIAAAARRARQDLNDALRRAGKGRAFLS